MSKRVDRMVAETALDSAPGESLSRLCVACATEFDVSSAGVALIVLGEHRGTLADSGAAAEAIENLQYTLGEGPCLDAHTSGQPVSEPDLGTGTRWPAFSPAAMDEGLRAVFAFPLQIGAAHFGALDLYRDMAGELSAADFNDARAVANVANGFVLDLLAQAGPGSLPRAVDDLIDQRAVIHQAVGMISVQLDCSVEDAHVALRARAFTDGRSVNDVAVDIVDRSIRFDR